MVKLFLPILGLAVAGLAFTADKPKSESPHHHAFDACAKACGDCQRACDSCGAHCATLLAQGQKDHLQTLQTCQDCATVCSAAAGITARQGPFAGPICKACADACAACGKACEKFAADAHMKQCAEECKRCEKACREMLKHLDGGK